MVVMLMTSSFSPKSNHPVSDIGDEPAVQYNQNDLVEVDRLQPFYRALDQYIAGQRDKIIITHIGDSHVQADYMTQETRILLQKALGNGGRGFVFPFRMLRTNGPQNVGLKYGGIWESCRSILSNGQCNFGLGGTTATTFDTGAFLRMDPNYYRDMNYEFNRVKLFHLQSPGSFDISLKHHDGSALDFDYQPISSTVSEIFFTEMQDSIWMSFTQRQEQNFFQLYGMSFENNHRGVIYNAIGQNGAFVKSYLKHAYFGEQMAALNSDLVIISLGTNDGYMSEGLFCDACFKDNYRELLRRIKKANPKSSLILTTPGDFFVRQRYHNGNIHKIIEAIYTLSREFDAAIWDFNKVMGGDNSIKRWRDDGLARGDLVHFTEKGYALQGRLLYQSIMGGFEKRFD